jgi:hypothetical protein
MPFHILYLLHHSLTFWAGSDIDNAPGKFWTADTIQGTVIHLAPTRMSYLVVVPDPQSPSSLFFRLLCPALTPVLLLDDDDAFFVIEHVGVLSQYFLAISPRHPLMYLCILISLQRILAMDHVGKQNIPVVTGPGALKVAFKYFMKTPPSSLSIQQDDEKEQGQQQGRADPPTKYGRVKAGKYYGVGNRSVTVVGTKDTGSKWVVRGSVDNKGKGYQAMGMKHFSTIAKKKFNESCLVHLWNLEFDSHNFNATNW